MPDPRRPDPASTESRRAQRHHQRQVARRRRLLLLVGGVVVAAVAATVAVVVIRDTDDGEGDEPALLLVLDDYTITGSLVVPAGDVKFAVANIGTVTHNVGVRGGPRTSDLFPDQAWSLELRDLRPGTYELFCDIVGHEERGMVATLQVVEAGSVPVPTT